MGYIIGLGDRHTENIMYDSRNGDTVHVDMNCLFNKVSIIEEINVNLMYFCESDSASRATS